MDLPRVLIVAGFAAAVCAQGAHAGTLEEVQARGNLNCGVSLGVPGFSLKQPGGRWTGLDVDTCRAIAAAVFGDADKVAYSALSSKERFTTLQAGDVDVLALNTTWTLLRDIALELNFAGVTYYDGQGFIVRKDLG
jgi:general L-amino acid transport system substrate-binding protein